MKKFLSFLWEISKIIVIAIIIVIPIRYFLFQPFFVKGQSMNPNFENGDYLIVDEISYRFRDPQRGEVVVFKYPQDLSQRFIKRVIGLPNETIEIKEGEKILYDENEVAQVLDESVYLDENLETLGNLKIVLNKNEYFVLGDNRDFSFDSRKFGVIKKEEIIGRAFLRTWPFDSLTKFEIPSYQMIID